MKSKNFKTSILMKREILPLLISAFLVTTALFTSCSKSTEDVLVEEATLTDDQLIVAIETNGVSSNLEVSDLPVLAQIELENEFEEDTAYDIKVAEGLGFEVKMIADQGAFATELNSAFFSANGEYLENKRRPRHGKRRSCFHISFPFMITMPDDSTITLESKNDKSLIRDWYTANPDVTEKPSLVFPVEIEYQDGDTATISNEAELQAAREGCRKVRCFGIVYPYTLIMPDDSTIMLTAKDDRYLVREWYRENRGIRERPVLVFPVDIEFEDGTIQTINNEDELQTAKDSCS